MHTFTKSGSATAAAPPGSGQPAQDSVRISECVYQSVTIAAMLLVLASLWVF